MSDLSDYFARGFDDHLQVAEASRELESSFCSVLDVWLEAVRAGRKLLFFGNGGSAADAQHFAAEMVVRFSVDRKPIPAIALTTDSSILTATANDLGAERVFARQIEALGERGDVAVASSTSGNSPNVLNALAVAREKGLKTVALTGGGGGRMIELADVSIVVPSPVTARIQEMHLLIGHLLCGALERELGLTETA